jgi:hypothetical protein
MMNETPAKELRGGLFAELKLLVTSVLKHQKVTGRSFGGG